MANRARRNLVVGVALLVLTAVTGAYGQGPGGGGGAGGGGGIPLGGGGGGSDSNEPKPDKKTLNERPVNGVVTDAEGNPVKGAVVQLKDTKTQKVRSLVTKEKGEYQFTGLSKDVDYQLSASFNDHSSAPHTLSTFDSRSRPTVNLQLK